MDLSLAASSFARNWMSERGKDQNKSAVVHVGIDVKLCFKREGDLVRKKYRIGANTKIVVVVARLVESKYPMAVLEIFDALIKTGKT